MMMLCYQYLYTNSSLGPKWPISVESASCYRAHCLFPRCAQVFPESVTGVYGGVVGSSSGQGEVLVSTYTGQVYGLSRGQTGHSKGTVSREVQTRIDLLRYVPVLSCGERTSECLWSSTGSV